MKRYRHLPQALQFICAAFAAAPVGFAIAVGLHFRAATALPGWYVVYLTLTYAALPIVLAALILRRHALFLMSFGLECCLLLLHVFIGGIEMPVYMRFVHYGFAMLAAAMAVMLINKDILFPFIFERYRGFRQAPRVALNHIIEAEFPRLKKTFSLMIEDASLTGLSAYGAEDSMLDILLSSERGEQVFVVYQSGKQKLRVACWYLWSAEASSIVKIGLRAADRGGMDELFRALGLAQHQPPFSRRMASMWGRLGVRRALTYCVGVAVTAIMMVPVVDSRWPVFTRRGSVPVTPAIPVTPPYPIQAPLPTPPSDDQAAKKPPKKPKSAH